jgi:ribonuclease P protein component
MLPKINRIKKKKDFETIFKNSKSFRANLFIFRISENNLGINRFGFVVSKKVSKSAVVRNKVRRRLSDIMRAESEKMKMGIDLIIITFPGIDKKDFSEVKDSIESTLSKVGLMIKKQ